jgi:hypothetical protein
MKLLVILCSLSVGAFAVSRTADLMHQAAAIVANSAHQQDS